MSILERTDDRDWNVYARGCDASKYEKAKALRREFVKPGIIVDLGSGTGIVEVILSELSSKEESERSFVVGVDISPEMLERAKDRKKEYEKIPVDLVRNDLTKSCIANESVDTVLCFSFLHEIYSDSGLETMMDVLRDVYRMLKPEGRLIIRDGPRSKNWRKSYYSKFNKKATEELFYKFARDFDPHNFVEDYIPEEKPEYSIDFEKLDDGMIRLSGPDCFEFLTKYIYKENWDVEVKEKFGVFTPEQWKIVLESLGFKVNNSETYLIPYLNNRYTHDGIELYKKFSGEYVPTEYPDSTMILVAEKV